ATLGAALTSFVGVKCYKSIDEARKSFFTEEKVFYPNYANSETLDRIFDRYLKALENLRRLYGAPE
ncbi:MAG: hypothetical protein N3E47_08520, partial [Candidatus Bathyarchaeota archaeon]|nr:hypothetical protein [Candidatus Bathyarchaeota archaeon]